MHLGCHTRGFFRRIKRAATSASIVHFPTLHPFGAHPHHQTNAQIAELFDPARVSKRRFGAPDPALLNAQPRSELSFVISAGTGDLSD